MPIRIILDMRKFVQQYEEQIVYILDITNRIPHANENIFLFESICNRFGLRYFCQSTRPILHNSFYLRF
ncbi:hypothetical protein NY2A_b686R [Paramecium bursaria Chlorella virus NY2A]|uniref:Uncharacterized protein b686R n=1 Tax=Paramecium bursaria Chlorella virus NY2A TaxID=46021 RepID=A7IXL1_PBCVN|nr:hypothetical protein NY2A_b686R [Paramecium bursaria Chlorella virus NY2A]ABT15085.1 hypothetical protein NY2A_b686R [Paramecium bursaria Chlorella virus NY2A]